MPKALQPLARGCGKMSFTNLVATPGQRIPELIGRGLNIV
jgi:hypothetical protein